MYLKDFRIFGDSIHDIFIVDNLPINYLYNWKQGIPILPFYGNTHDSELLKLADYL